MKIRAPASDLFTSPPRQRRESFSVVSEKGGASFASDGIKRTQSEILCEI